MTTPTSNPCPVLAAGTVRALKDSYRVPWRDFNAGDEGAVSRISRARRWAISILLEAGAIRECEEHGWMRDRSDPHARERALQRPTSCRRLNPLEAHRGQIQNLAATHRQTSPAPRNDSAIPASRS